MKKSCIAILVTLLFINISMTASESVTRILRDKMQSFSRSIDNFKELYKKCRQQGCSAQETVKLQSQMAIVGGVGATILFVLTVVGIRGMGKQKETFFQAEEERFQRAVDEQVQRERERMEREKEVEIVQQRTAEYERLFEERKKQKEEKEKKALARTKRAKREERKAQEERAQGRLKVLQRHGGRK